MTYFLARRTHRGPTRAYTDCGTPFARALEPPVNALVSRGLSLLTTRGIMYKTLMEIPLLSNLSPLFLLPSWILSSFRRAWLK